MRARGLAPLALALAFPLFAGCALYFPDEDDDDVIVRPTCMEPSDCPDGFTCSFEEGCYLPPDCGSEGACTAVCAGICVSDVPCAAEQSLRNPETGRCESFGLCGGDEAVPTEREPAGDIYVPDWGMCGGTCEGLDEQTCLATAFCRAAYVDLCPYCDALHLQFIGCWATAPTGPIEPRPCGGLDAQACSLNDTCSAVHQVVETYCADGTFCTCDSAACVGRFEYCKDEVSVEPPPPVAECMSDEMCGEGLRCNAAELCLPPPGCENGACPCDDPATGCTAVCWGFCVPGEEPPPPSAECMSDEMCAEGLRCNAAELCLPPPGCDAAGEDCAAVCWGFCVPIEEPPPPPACADLWDEALCIQTLGCAPVYEGVDCVCDDSGCTCASWEFLACRAE